MDIGALRFTGTSFVGSTTKDMTVTLENIARAADGGGTGEPTWGISGEEAGA